MCKIFKFKTEVLSQFSARTLNLNQTWFTEEKLDRLHENIQMRIRAQSKKKTWRQSLVNALSWRENRVEWAEIFKEQI